MNMKNMKKILLTALTLCSTMAFALDLDGAKSQGLVGERPDGYLGLVHGGDADAAALVKDINYKRRQVYADIAAKRGTSIEAVEATAGAKAIEKTEPGNFILKGDHWVRK